MFFFGLITRSYIIHVLYNAEIFIAFQTLIILETATIILLGCEGKKIYYFQADLPNDTKRLIRIPQIKIKSCANLSSFGLFEAYCSAVNPSPQKAKLL